MASFVKTGDTRRVFIGKKGVHYSATFDTSAEAMAQATSCEAEINAGARGDIVPCSVRAAFTRYAKEVSRAKRGARWETFQMPKFERQI